MAHYKVLKYDSERMEHKVKVLAGRNAKPTPFYVDLLVSGNFDNIQPESLVGEVVSIDRMHPSSYIADKVSLANIDN